MDFDTAINMAMTASVQTGILTISVLGNNGSAISSTNPVLIPFKNTTLANGSPVWVAQTGSLSLSTFTTSAKFGATNATPFRLWITALYNGGNPLLALINCSNSAAIYPLAQHTLVNGVGITGTSNGGGVFYTSNGTTISTTAFCILGYAEYTAGNAYGQAISPQCRICSCSVPASRSRVRLFRLLCHFQTHQHR